MTKQALMDKLVETSNKIQKETETGKYHFIVIGRYADRSDLVKQLIDQRADQMRAQFREQGLDFDAWRSGVEDIRIHDEQG